MKHQDEPPSHVVYPLVKSLQSRAQMRSLLYAKTASNSDPFPEDRSPLGEYFLVGRLLLIPLCLFALSETIKLADDRFVILC